MRKGHFVIIPLVVCLFLLTFGQPASSQTTAIDGPIATVTTSGEGITWQPRVAYSDARLTVAGPDGVRHQSFGPDAKVILPLVGDDGQPLPDGSYTYELRLAPVLSAAAQAALSAAASTEERQRVVELLQARGELPTHPLVQTGSFMVSNGAVIMGGTAEPEGGSSMMATESGDMIEDQVIPDDMIVQGSLCAGIDCVDNESFGYDTIRLKENNLRIRFDDTSASAGFPANDWELRANDSASGGANVFAIEDITAGLTPFTVEADASDNALYIDSTGHIGFGTATPVLELHVATGDTPALRLEQTVDSGWTPQTWDVAGNEANFFIRDVTGGSRLPFRIRPGAPTSSLDVAASGNVGIGTTSPDAQLHVSGDNAAFRVENTAGSEETVILDLDENGNLTIHGLLTEASDVSLKENFVTVNTASTLEGILGLELTTWNYTADGDGVRHMGPMAQDFYELFGLGADNRHIAPLDVNGVTLAGIQEMYHLMQTQEARIEVLEQENAELNQRLADLEETVNSLITAQSAQD